MAELFQVLLSIFLLFIFFFDCSLLINKIGSNLCKSRHKPVFHSNNLFIYLNLIENLKIYICLCKNTFEYKNQLNTHFFGPTSFTNFYSPACSIVNSAVFLISNDSLEKKS